MGQLVRPAEPAGEEPLLLGVDGGASKTVALLADAAGRAIGRGESGGSNPRALGRARAEAALAAAVDQAFGSAGLAPRLVGAACLGLAGAGRAEEQRVVRQWAAARGLAARVDVCDDARLVIAAGTPDDWGVAVIGGTGSIAVARSSDGRGGRAGGWGYLLGDEGGGYAIGSAAARAAVRAADGRGPATLLLPGLLAAWELAAATDLIGYLYDQADPRGALADLVPLVARTAAAGDGVAAAILAQAGGDLAELAEAAARQAALGPAIPLALAGGVVCRVAEVRRALEARLAAAGWQPALTLVDEPARGAVRLAARLLA